MQPSLQQVDVTVCNQLPDDMYMLAVTAALP